jgi:hypothetical protein
VTDLISFPGGHVPQEFKALIKLRLEVSSELSFGLVLSSVADPVQGSGCGIRWLFDPWVRDGLSQDLDPESGINNPDHTF